MLETRLHGIHSVLHHYQWKLRKASWLIKKLVYAVELCLLSNSLSVVVTFNLFPLCPKKVDIFFFVVYPTNKEILLEPEMDYEVKNVMLINQLTLVELQALPTPLLLRNICSALPAAGPHRPLPPRPMKSDHSFPSLPKPATNTGTSNAPYSVKSEKLPTKVDIKPPTTKLAFDFDAYVASSNFQAVADAMNSCINNAELQAAACKSLAQIREG